MIITLVYSGPQDVEFPIRKTLSEPNLKVKSALKQKLIQDRRNSPLTPRRRQLNSFPSSTLTGMAFRKHLFYSLMVSSQSCFQPDSVRGFVSVMLQYHFLRTAININYYVKPKFSYFRKLRERVFTCYLHITPYELRLYSCNSWGSQKICYKTIIWGIIYSLIHDLNIATSRGCAMNSSLWKETETISAACSVRRILNFLEIQYNIMFLGCLFHFVN